MRTVENGSEMTHMVPGKPSLATSAEDKKPLVLHIGLQKTGTSSIQTMLADSAAYLREEGFFYPSLPKREGTIWNAPFRHNILVSTYADFPSAFERLDAAQEDRFWKDLESSPLTPILSAEEFSRLRTLDRLAGRLKSFDVHLVAFLRRQDLLAESLYNQRNKILLSRNDPRLLASDLLRESALFEFLKTENYTPLLNYDRLLANFVTALAPSRVSVRAFDRSQLLGGDVCRSFSEVLGLDGHRMRIPPAEVNGSIANSLLKEIVKIYKTEGRQAALDRVRSVNQEIQSGKDFSGSYNLLSDRSRQAVLQQYAEINERVADAYGVKFTAGGPH